MDTYFTIGKVSIVGSWIATIAALFLASFLYRLILKNKVDDWYWNSFFIYFFLWKFSYILFSFDTFIQFPLSILYFNGGKAGHFVGLFALAIYLLFFSYKKYPSVRKQGVPVFLLFMLSFEGLFHLFNQNYSALTVYLLAFLLLVHLFLHNKHVNQFDQLAIIYLLMNILLNSIFDLFFSIKLFTFIWLSGVLFILMQIEKRVDS